LQVSSISFIFNQLFRVLNHIGMTKEIS